MNWDEILKQPRRPGRRPQRPDNGGGGGTRDRVKPAQPKLILESPKTKTKTGGPKSKARDRPIIQSETAVKTTTDKEYEGDCVCDQEMCKRKAEYKCKRCRKRYCVYHKRLAETKKKGRGGHIHNIQPWDCETNKYYTSIEDLREEAGEP